MILDVVSFPSVISKRRAALALLAGVAHATVVLYVLFVGLSVTRAVSHPVPFALTNAFSLLFLVLAGAVPAYLLLRYRLVVPPLLAGYLTWASLRDHLVGYQMEPFTPLYYNPIILFTVLCVVYVAAAVEYGLRDRLPLFPPKPLVR